MRLFFAIEGPPLPPWDPATAATEPAGVLAHLTLEFLGEVASDRLAELESVGRATVVGVVPFEIELGRVGAFPSERDPRVVWVGVDRGVEPLIELRRRLRENLSRTGIPLEDRPFLAHVTWRRVRGSRDAGIARAHLAEGRLARTAATTVDRLRLKASDLRSSGAVHRTVAEFPLGAAA